MKRQILFVFATSICFVLSSYGQDKSSQQQSDKVQAATPEVVGKQMFETIDDVTFSSYEVVKRSKLFNGGSAEGGCRRV